MSLYGDVFGSVFQHFWLDDKCADEDIAQHVEGLVEGLANELKVSRQVTYFTPATGWSAYYHLEDDSEAPLKRDMSHGLLCSFEDGDLSIMECEGRRWIDVSSIEGFLGLVGPGGSDLCILEEFKRRIQMIASFNGISELTDNEDK